jgi:hypothetical protein
MRIFRGRNESSGFAFATCPLIHSTIHLIDLKSERLGSQLFGQTPKDPLALIKRQQLPFWILNAAARRETKMSPKEPSSSYQTASSGAVLVNSESDDSLGNGECSGNNQNQHASSSCKKKTSKLRFCCLPLLLELFFPVVPPPTEELLFAIQNQPTRMTTHPLNQPPQLLQRQMSFLQQAVIKKKSISGFASRPSRRVSRVLSRTYRKKLLSHFFSCTTAAPPFSLILFYCISLSYSFRS